MFKLNVIVHYFITHICTEYLKLHTQDPKMINISQPVTVMQFRDRYLTFNFAMHFPSLNHYNPSMVIVILKRLSYAKRWLFKWIPTISLTLQNVYLSCIINVRIKATAHIAEFCCMQSLKIANIFLLIFNICFLLKDFSSWAFFVP